MHISAIAVLGLFDTFLALLHGNGRNILWGTRVSGL